MSQLTQFTLAENMNNSRNHPQHVLVCVVVFSKSATLRRRATPPTLSIQLSFSPLSSEAHSPQADMMNVVADASSPAAFKFAP